MVELTMRTRYIKSCNIFLLFADDFEPQPVEEANGRCRYSDDFVRHCDHAITVLYGLSPEQCLTKCSNDFAVEFAKAHIPLAFQIWSDVRTTNCWLWRADAKNAIGMEERALIDIRVHKCSGAMSISKRATATQWTSQVPKTEAK